MFSQMTMMLDILMDYCYLRGFKFSRLDGSMSYSDREENVSTCTCLLNLILNSAFYCDVGIRLEPAFSL